MQPSTIAVILAVGCMECMAYAAVDEVLALLLASLSAQHPGYALLLKCLRWLLQALFYALLGWQGMSMLLLGLNYTDAARGAALVAAVDSAAATPRRKRREGARAGAAEPPSPSGAGAGFAAAPPTALVPAAAAAASAAAATAASAAAASPAHAYAEQRRALALRERLAAASPEGETLRFAPCTRDLDAPWAEVLAAQLRNACIRPLVPGDVGAREADPDAPPGVRAFKRRRSVQLVVAEHLTPELRQGVAFVSSVASVPAIVKLIETTWEVPDAQWACVLRELCPTDKVSLGWARHRVRVSLRCRGRSGRGASLQKSALTPPTHTPPTPRPPPRSAACTRCTPLTPASRAGRGTWMCAYCTAGG